MVLAFLDRIEETGKKQPAASHVAETLRWMSLASSGEKWDVAMDLGTRKAFERACRLLGIPEEPLVEFNLKPPQGSGESIAHRLFSGGKAGIMRVTAGDPDNPSFITAELPPGAPPEFDAKTYAPAPIPERPPPSLTFWEPVPGPPVPLVLPERTRRAYEAASVALGVSHSIDDWLQVVARHDTTPRTIWSSVLAKDIPYNVDVDARSLSSKARASLFGQWLDLLPEVTEIQARCHLSTTMLQTLVLEATEPGTHIKPKRWGLNTWGRGCTLSRENILSAFSDPEVEAQIRSWQVRASSIMWNVADPTIVVETGSSSTLVQASRTFRRTIEIVFAIEDMDSPRFQIAIGVLDGHVPAKLQSEAAWRVWGDPASTPRGRQQLEYWKEVRQAARDALWRRSGGVLSSLVNLRSSERPTGPKGDVQLKKALITSMQADIPEFPFDDVNSIIGTSDSDIFMFVRRRTSGTRNFLFFYRDRDPYASRAFDVEAGVSAVAGHPYAGCTALAHGQMASAVWGMYGLIKFAEVEGFRWYYNSQDTFDRALSKAIRRIRKVIMPMFDDVEPILVKWHALARR